MMAPIDQIASSINQIAHISMENASKTQQVSVSVDNQSSSSEEINASAASLAKMAEELQEIVQKFKI
ncbi:methyl-accepting chemotaxis protein [Paenibacillus sp. PvR052]